jgi:transcriptional regulator with XRE-family HTH domain
MNVAERLRERRQAAGIDIKEAALRTKKSYQYIRQLEEGINNPPAWPLLGELAALYECSVDYLLGLTTDPAPRPASGVTAEDRELIDLMQGLSEHGRAEAAAMLQVICEQDQRWQALDMYERFIGALGGEDYLARLADTFDALVRETGSVDAALDRLDTLTSEQSAQNSIQHRQ